MPYFGSAKELQDYAALFVRSLTVGDIVLLDGPLGVGKTTFVRGMLRGLGYVEAVRSPTYNLLQTFDTTPPLLHADLYRVESAAGLGLEDYWDSHLIAIEWPDRLGNSVDPSKCFQLHFKFKEEGREVAVSSPAPQPLTPNP